MIAPTPTKGQSANIAWSQLDQTWDGTAYYWNIVKVFLGGKNSQTELDIYEKLNENQKHKVVSLYVEIFKTHLSQNERLLLERSGINQTYFNEQEVNEIVRVNLIDKNVERKDLNELKTKTLHDLFKVLDIKIT
jgi:hypothetical protein